jgi:hypothetical protein
MPAPPSAAPAADAEWHAGACHATGEEATPETKKENTDGGELDAFARVAAAPHPRATFPWVRGRSQDVRGQSMEEGEKIELVGRREVVGKMEGVSALEIAEMEAVDNKVDTAVVGREQKEVGAGGGQRLADTLAPTRQTPGVEFAGHEGNVDVQEEDEEEEEEEEVEDDEVVMLL